MRKFPTALLPREGWIRAGFPPRLHQGHADAPGPRPDSWGASMASPGKWASGPLADLSLQETWAEPAASSTWGGPAARAPWALSLLLWERMEERGAGAQVGDWSFASNLNQLCLLGARAPGLSLESGKRRQKGKRAWPTLALQRGREAGGRIGRAGSWPGAPRRSWGWGQRAPEVPAVRPTSAPAGPALCCQPHAQCP